MYAQYKIQFNLLHYRAAHLKNDGGDAAFPGGMQDPDDRDETETCLREAKEEIDLHRDQVKIVAQLLPKSKGNILVTQVVGIVDPSFVPMCNPDEVQGAYCLPLQRFLSDGHHKSNLVTMRDKTFYVHWFTDYIGKKTFVTWGFTGFMCVEIAMVIFQKEPMFAWDSSGVNTVENPYLLQKQSLYEYTKDSVDNFISKM